MADLYASGNAERELDKWLVALKKGTQLLKYGRKGKPKFYPFRLSHDESTLIWLSSSGERSLKLSSVSRIIPGQRTAVFQRYLRPDKDYLSFSLIYSDGKRSLDVICKDKVEAEVWFSGLKTLISSSQYGRSKVDGWSNGSLHSDDTREFASNSLSDHSIGSYPEYSEGRLTTSSLQKTHSFEFSVYSDKSDVTNMLSKGNSSDGFRISTSSAPSTSSHGSAQDDFDASGDVYVWGEVICDSSARLSADRNSIPTTSSKTDILLPKPLESNVVLDIHHVSCGVRHAALVTRQGEVFTWGEESGGRLGHGVGTDSVHPRLVESLAASSVEFVACGEYHTCAVTVSGDLYTWGDGTHNAGLLGHGTDVSHWVPKRISGPLEGQQVSYVSCGVWHTAIITVMGQLFTFGDGTFGALGHGNRETVRRPREVESLTGLRTVAVSCGVWHTAAVVEVIMTQSSTSSGKLFTWGDGDKFRLGHGDKEPKLKPTCVPTLIDYNFYKVACGHSLTIGLTTSGHVFTMGSNVYGQLGNPRADGKVPCSVDELVRETVAEVACGSYHVAVLTAKGEVYTWGRGANGRLGHGNVEDRKTPTLVEALKDRPVKRISCGSNFTAAICQHKWVSGAEQSQCSSCRQSFGFTRKRHNCYNCGLVHCHQCSSRKALRAALSPNPGKPYRVCDMCYVKLSNSFEGSGHNSKKSSKPRLSAESKDKFDKLETSSSKSSFSGGMDLFKNLEIKVSKTGKNSSSFSIPKSPQMSSVKSMGFDMYMLSPKPVETSVGQSASRQRSISPFSRKPSPPRSTTPTPTTSGLSFPKNISDSLKKTNDLLNQELLRLQAEVDSLRQRSERQDLELQKSEKKAQEALALAAEESAKSKAAKEVIKTLTAQLKEMAERLPHGVNEGNALRPPFLSNGFLHSHGADISPRHWLVNSAANGTTPSQVRSTRMNDAPSQSPLGREALGSVNASTDMAQHSAITHNELAEQSGTPRESNVETPKFSNRKEEFDNNAALSLHNRDNDSLPRSPSAASNQIEAEWIEQFEPGVYITLIALRDGTRDLKRVRFSRRRFGEQQAEAWWSENRDRVFEKYNFRGPDRT